MILIWHSNWKLHLLKEWEISMPIQYKENAVTTGDEKALSRPNPAFQFKVWPYSNSSLSVLPFPPSSGW